MSEPDFGLDLSCDFDLDPRGVEVNGFLALAQALARRLDTPEGTLVGDDSGSYGYDLAELVSLGMTAEGLRAVPEKVRAQFLDDERVSAADVKVLSSPSTSEIRLDCRVVGLRGPFRFTIAISDVGAQLFDVQEAA